MKWQNKTRSGQPVRFYCEDAGGQYPIHGAVQSKYDDAWEAVIWTHQGLFHIDDWHEYDLVPAKVRRWKTAEELAADWVEGKIENLQCFDSGSIEVRTCGTGNHYKSNIPMPMSAYNDVFLDIFTVED